MHYCKLNLTVLSMLKATKLARFSRTLLSAAQNGAKDSKIRRMKRVEELKQGVKYDMIAPI